MPLELDMEELRFGTELLKRGFARMQKGGVIMDVTNREEAAMLADQAYLQKLVMGIYTGIRRFVSNFESTKGFTE